MSETGEELHLSDNEHQVSYANVVAPGDHPSPTQSLPTGYVIQIATKDAPEADPFHFWIGEDQLRDLLAQAGRHLDPSHQERHQILEALGRIEKLLEYQK